jgi:hypothetical protein
MNAIIGNSFDRASWVTMPGLALRAWLPYHRMLMNEERGANCKQTGTAPRRDRITPHDPSQLGNKINGSGLSQLT